MNSDTVVTSRDAAYAALSVLHTTHEKYSDRWEAVLVYALISVVAFVSMMILAVAGGQIWGIYGGGVLFVVGGYCMLELGRFLWRRLDRQTVLYSPTEFEQHDIRHDHQADEEGFAGIEYSFAGKNLSVALRFADRIINLDTSYLSEGFEVVQREFGGTKIDEWILIGQSSKIIYARGSMEAMQALLTELVYTREGLMEYIDELISQ